MYAIVVLYTEPGDYDDPTYPVAESVIAPFSSEAEANAYGQKKKLNEPMFTSWDVVPYFAPEAMSETEEVSSVACWPLGNRRGCDRTVIGDYSAVAEPGWSWVHYKGQMYCVCPDHRESGWDAYPMNTVEPQESELTNSADKVSELGANWYDAHQRVRAERDALKAEVKRLKEVHAEHCDAVFCEDAGRLWKAEY